MIFRKIFRGIWYIILILSVIISALFVYCMPHKNDLYKESEKAVRHLIGKDISACDDIWDRVMYTADGKKVYYAGVKYTYVLGMYDSEYYEAVISYDESGTITGAELNKPVQN